MDGVNKIAKMVEEIGNDAEKFFDEDYNKAAVSARKKLQQLKQAAQDVRVAIQERKNAMPVAAKK